jgi:hypothetical protein
MIEQVIYYIVYFLFTIYKVVSEDIKKAASVPAKVVPESTKELYSELKKYFDSLNAQKTIKNDILENPPIPSPMKLFYKSMYTLNIPIETVINSNLFKIKDSEDFKNFMKSLRSNKFLLIKDAPPSQQSVPMSVPILIDSTVGIPLKIMDLNSTDRSPMRRSITKKYPVPTADYLKTEVARKSRGLGFF